MNSASVPTTLPQELVDIVIDHLYNDTPSLMKCSLVSHAWLSTSRLHLFSKIRLDIPKVTHHSAEDVANLVEITHEPCQRLTNLLFDNSEIIPRVHDLTIVSGSPMGPTALRDRQYHLIWVFVEKTLPILLREFTHLRRLELTSPQGSLYWNSLPRPLKDAIETVSPLLEYLRIKAWDFPRLKSFDRLLRHCSNLKGLALRSIRLGPEDNPYSDVQDAEGDGDADESVVVSQTEQDQSEVDGDIEDTSADKDLNTAIVRDDMSDDVATVHRRTPGPRLDFLTLDYIKCAYFSDWLLDQPSLLDVSSLAELRIAHSYDKTIQRLLHTIGRSLLRFHFKPGPLGFQPLDLSGNTALRCVRITLDEDLGALSWISSLLSTIPTPSVLERVALELYTDPKRLATEEWLTLRGAVSNFSSNTVLHIGLFASPNSAEFCRVKSAMGGVDDGEKENRESGPEVQVYQLGTKKQSSLCVGLAPLIEKFESDD